MDLAFFFSFLFSSSGSLTLERTEFIVQALALALFCVCKESSQGRIQEREDFYLGLFCSAIAFSHPTIPDLLFSNALVDRISNSSCWECRVCLA